MQFVTAIIVSCVFLCSCSFPSVNVSSLPELEGKAKSLLLNIRIERWGTVRFSGLLALQKNEKGLRYILLDGTGIKLVETAVHCSSSCKATQVEGSLKDSKLVPFLTEALVRVYLLEPEEQPCSQSWFLVFCNKAEGNGEWLKSAMAGPTTLWTVENRETNESGLETIYRQPWLGLQVVLRKVEHFE